MKLATLKDHTRDGQLIVTNRAGNRYADAAATAPHLQAALDDWQRSEAQLRELAGKLEAGSLEGQPLNQAQLHSPLPRAYEWIDGSAYINHVILVRKARGADPPETLETDPLVYQGGSGVFLAPTEDIPLVNPDWGLDLEAEICVVLDDTPLGTTREEAEQHIKLLMLCNDVTLRNLIPTELAKGFGFFQGKPASAFSPLAITPDELGSAWRAGRVQFPLHSRLNGNILGDPEAGPEMHFSFLDLIQHVCKTRALTAGTILGSGTVSNEDARRGVSCLAERRMREKIATGKASTPFLQLGDTVEIEMLDGEGQSLFGCIRQKVVKYR